MIGQFVAKALLDSRIIDMSLNKIFLKLVLEEDVAQTLTSLKVSANEVYCTKHYLNTVIM